MLDKRLREVINMLEKHDIKIVSYGLAPNPFGFCFESNASEKIKKEFSLILDSLSESQERILRKYIFG